MPKQLLAATTREPLPAWENDLSVLHERLVLLTRENLALKAQLFRREQKAKEEAELKFDLRAITGAGNHDELGLAILKAAVRWSGAWKGVLRFLTSGTKVNYAMPGYAEIPAENQYIYTRSIKHRGQPLALVELIFNGPQQSGPSKPHLKQLAFLAQFSAKILAQLKRYHEAVYLANYDGLTGLGNRRVFDETLIREYERALRHNLPLSLIILDLDHFKLVNDRYGHQIGDQCLKVTGRVIKGAIRLPDYAARIGGEEFAVILPDTTIEQALILARRIEATLKAAAVQSAAKEPVKLTASLGLADNRFFWINSAENLLYWADKAMYLAKQRGRNQIRMATELKQTSEEKAGHVFQ